MGVVEFEDVVKSYDSTQALRGATFEVPKNCVAGLVGPNGAGKTTSLKIAIGALRRDYGTVSVLGYDPWEEPERVRALTGFLPEVPQFPSVKVWKLLLHVAKLKVGSGAEREVRRVSRLVGIKGVMGKVASKLSAGYRQRVALALAMIGEPKLLILDEPAANLDPGARSELYELIKNLNKDYGVSILLSTHILAEAQEILDYLIIISKGVIVAEGWITELVREAKLSVRAVFRVPKGIELRRLVTDLMSTYEVEGVSIKGNELVIEGSSDVVRRVKEYLSKYGIELVEERTGDLLTLYNRLVGGAS